MTLKIAAGSTASTGTSVAFPGEYSNRSFLFSARFKLGRELNLGEELVIWQSNPTTHQSVSGFPTVNITSQHKISIKKVANTLTPYQLKFQICAIDNWPALSTWRTGVYLHKMNMASLPFAPNGSIYTGSMVSQWQNIYFRFRGFDYNTNPTWLTNNTSADMYAYATSSNGMNYTSCYVNGGPMWLGTSQSGSLNWTRYNQGANITGSLYYDDYSNGWAYDSVDTNSTYNRLGPFNQGVGTYFTGFSQSILGDGSNGTSIELDNIWIGDWDAYYRGTDPYQTPKSNFFWNSVEGNPDTSPDNTGTLASGLRAKLYYSSSSTSSLTNLGSLETSGDLITRTGTVYNTIVSDPITISSEFNTSINGGINVSASSSMNAVASVVSSPLKIINVVVGRYFSDDYVDPGYIDDSTFNTQSDSYIDADVRVGGFVNANIVSSLTTNAGIIFEQDPVYPILLEVYTDAVTQEHLIVRVSDAESSTFTMSVSGGVKYMTPQAALSSAFSFTGTPRNDFNVNVSLQSTATLTAQGSFVGHIIEIDDIVDYTWDSVTEWDNWPNAAWARTGVFLGSASTVTPVAGYRQYGNAALSSAFSLPSPFITRVLWALAGLYPEFTVTADSAIVKDAIAHLNSAFTTSTTGLRIQEIASTVFNNVSLTTNAWVTYAGVANLQTSLDTSIIGGVKWLTPEAHTEISLDTVIVGGVKWLTPEAHFTSFDTIGLRVTMLKHDSYRTFTILPELRTAAVYAEPRTIPVPENTRTIRVPVPPLQQPTIERQL